MFKSDFVVVIIIVVVVVVVVVFSANTRINGNGF
jgi:hypothetical protein